MNNNATFYSAQNKIFIFTQLSKTNDPYKSCLVNKNQRQRVNRTYINSSSFPTNNNFQDNI